jgi:hypothetical protein
MNKAFAENTGFKVLNKDQVNLQFTSDEFNEGGSLLKGHL